jgi:integrating conjugative element membrane protein (TIGR03745 family)
MKVVKTIGSKLFSFWVLCVLPGMALATGQLPTAEDPSRGTGSGIRETAQNHLYDAGVLIGLVIATLAFLAVAWHGVQVFSEVQHGKKKWADFGAVLIVGIVLIVLAIWLLTKAAAIL